ncbi:MAG: RNA methyltransferase [Flavobacteriaceae bacterium]
MSLSKNHIKLITSLRQKKYRLKHNLFIVEGVKVVSEFLNSSFELETIFLTDESLFDVGEATSIYINENELKKISSLKSPNKVLALFKIPEYKISNSKGITLVLDEINDPGNLGTIIRLCDWFGVSELVCSKNTVDCYNTKVIQASMGSLTRVPICYIDIVEFLKTSDKSIFIADMEGQNVYNSSLPEEVILIMGNEANGVSKQVKNIAKNSITIPRFGNTQQTESLNVATATAILLSEFRR